MFFVAISETIALNEKNAKLVARRPGVGRKGSFRPGHGRSRLFGRAWAENSLLAGARPKIVASAARRPNWAVFGPPVTEAGLFGQASTKDVFGQV